VFSLDCDSEGMTRSFTGNENQRPLVMRVFVQVEGDVLGFLDALFMFA
jgi:hypothetical protein